MSTSIAAASRPSSCASPLAGRRQETQDVLALVARASVVCIGGVSGVGKSELAMVIAREWTGPTVALTVGPGGLKELVERLLSRLGEVSAVGVLECDLVRQALGALEAQRALCVVDELERLSSAEREQLLRGAIDELRDARLILTCREWPAHPISASGVATFHLDALDRPNALAMWRALEKTGKARTDFDYAFKRSAGVPRLLLELFRGLVLSDPSTDWLAKLDANERLLVGALALNDSPLPGEILRQMVPADEGAAALARLERRFVVTVDPRGSFVLQALLAGPTLASLSAKERNALHSGLARLLLEGSPEQSAHAREAARHLGVLGQIADGVACLLTKGTEIDRMSAAGAALRGSIERSPSVDYDDRSPLIDLASYQQENERLFHEGREPREHYAALCGVLAHVRAEPDLAIERARWLLERAADEDGRLRAHMVLALALAEKGAHAAADDTLADPLRAVLRPEVATTLHMTRAYCAWHGGRDNDALDAALRARAQMALGHRSYRQAALIPALHAAVAARLGEREDARRAMTEARRALGLVSDPLVAAYSWFLLAHARAADGDLAGAAADFRFVLDASRRTGHVVGILHGTVALGGVWLAQGQIARGEAALAEGVALATARGCHGIVAIADRFRAWNPVRQLAAGLRPGTAPPAWERRADALESLRAAAAGDRDRARALSARAMAETAGAGGVEHACAHLCEVLSRLVDRCDPAQVRDGIQRARQALEQSGADAALVETLLDSLARWHVVSETGQRLVAELSTLDHFSVVIDATDKILRHQGGELALSQKPLLADIVILLAEHMGNPVSKDAICQSTFGRKFDPLVDEHTLKGNMSRLRRWLEGTGLEIHFSDGGYRLTSSASLVLVRRTVS